MNNVMFNEDEYDVGPGSAGWDDEVQGDMLPPSGPVVYAEVVDSESMEMVYSFWTSSWKEAEEILYFLAIPTTSPSAVICYINGEIVNV